MHSARKTLGVLLMLAGLLVAPSIARADSDGYFCAGKDYLVVEFRSFSTPRLSAPHVLKIVRFGMHREIHWAGEARLPDFQTHYMRCDSARVEIAGWANGEVAFTLDVTQEGSLSDLRPGKYAAGSGRKEPALSNLGLWSRPGVFPLQSDDPHHTYQIICTVSDHPVGQAVEHYHKSEVVQIDPSGKVSQRFLVFQGTAVEPID